MLPCWLTDTVTGDLDRALNYTLLWGLEGVELRRVGGEGERVPFVNEEKLRRRLWENEIPAAAIVPGVFEGAASDKAEWLNEIATFGETLQFCRRIGCSLVVVSALSDEGLEEAAYFERAADALRRLGEVAARRAVTLAVLNEADTGCTTATRLAALLDRVDHPAVQAAWSPATALKAGESASDGLAALGDRLALVRCRDGQVKGWTWADTQIGEGAVGWADVFAALKTLGFDGPVSLEMRLPNPGKSGVRAATRMIELMAGR